MKRINTIFLGLISLLFLPTIGYSQYAEVGFNAGLLATRYTVSTNILSPTLGLRQGKLDYSPRFGVQLALKGMPDKYKAFDSGLEHGLLTELSVCNCGGNTELFIREGGGNIRTIELDYVTWQADLGMLYMAKFEKTRIMLGPTVTYHTYRAVNDSRDPTNEYVYTQGQINQFYVGLDLGIGYRVEDLLVSLRYHTNLTNFGEPSNKVPAIYNLHQARFVLSYFLFEKRLRNRFRGLYF